MRGLVALLICSILVGACASNPAVTGQRDFSLLNEADELRQDLQSQKQIEQSYGVYQDPALQRLLNQVGERLIQVVDRPQLPYRFVLLDSEEINAFALPGGSVYVCRGLLAYLQSEAQLAAVLAHELAHVNARHAARRQSGQQLQQGIAEFLQGGSEPLGNLFESLSSWLLRGYSRQHELEADRIGRRYLQSAGYNSEAMAEVLDWLQQLEQYQQTLPWFVQADIDDLSHPHLRERLRALEVATLFKPPVVSEAGFLQQLQGLHFGPKALDGVIRGGRYSNNALGFALTFPQQWRLGNRPEELIAGRADGSVLMQLRPLQRDPAESLAQHLARLTQAPVSTQSQLYGGRVAATEVMVRQQLRPAFLWLFPLRDFDLLMVISAQDQAWDSADLLQTLASMERFDPGSRPEPALKLDLIRVDQAQTYSTLAARSPLTYDAQNQLRLLNQVYPAGEIPSNQLIKTIK